LNGSEEPPNLQLSSEQPRNFGPPFERRDADLIIRSCDQVDFHVHKAVLGVASTTFEDMFTAPGLGQGQAESVVNLAEDSKTLHRLLTAIYPVDLSIPETFEEYLSLIASCQKYQMDSTAAHIRSLLKERIPPLFASNPFRAYGIASQYHLEEEALLAARLTLERSMDFDTCGEDLHYIPGGDLFRLWKYRTKCTTVAKDCIKHMTGSDDAPLPSVCHSGRVNVGKSNTRALQYAYQHFFYRAAKQPSPKTITDWKAFENSQKKFCIAAGHAACFSLDETRQVKRICRTLEARLEVANDQVSIGCPFSAESPELDCTISTSLSR
jgi:BTB/POZ domain